MNIRHSSFAKAGAALIAVAALGIGTAAQARSNVYFSVGAAVAPGVTLGVSNAPVYYPPVYAAPVYAPAPVYYEPAPVVYGGPVYVRRAPIYVAPRYYGRPVVYRHGHRHWN